MAWNPSPDVADCREVGRKWGMQLIIILGINSKDGTFKVASFGETRQLCDAAKKINERIFDMVSDVCSSDLNHVKDSLIDFLRGVAELARLAEAGDFEGSVF